VAGEQPYVYTCRFCGSRIPIAPLVKPRDARADLARAALELREARQREAAVAVRAVKKTAKSVGCIVVLSTLVPLLIPVLLFLVPWGMRTYAANFGAFPVTVDPNGSLEISDRDATSTDTMITVGVNGKLTLRRCHLKGPQIVKGGTNAQITVIDSTLEGSKGIVEGEINVTLTVQNSTLISGEEIVDAPLNAKVSISKGSKVQSASVAFPLENNAEVTVDQSEVDGKLGVFELRNGGHVKLVDSAVVKSDGTAIDLAHNGRLTVTSSRVESKTTAVRASSSLEGALRSATVIGPRAALDLGSVAHLTIAQSTVEGPRKLGPGSTVDDR
jgi:hypothetical protein